MKVFNIDLILLSLSLSPSLSLVSTQLQQVALRLVKESFGDVMYSKAMDCIKTLREEMIGVSSNGETPIITSFIYSDFSILNQTCLTST